MKKITGIGIIRNTAKYCNAILALRERDVRQNIHLIRASSALILAVKKEFSECAKDESGSLSIAEESFDFCEISHYALTEESLERFLCDISSRHNLSYGEIACLIPTLIYCCLQGFYEKKCNANTLICSLSVLHHHDGSRLAETLSKTEEVLKKDAVYPHLDETSKKLYRNKIRFLAKKYKMEERSVAVDLLKAARASNIKEDRQIGILLFPQRKNKLYFPILFFLTGILWLGVFLAANSAILSAISLIPVVVCAKILCDTLFSKVIRPTPLPKLKITEENCPKTLVTIVSLLSDRKEAETLLHRLDVLAHRIPLQNIRIGLLLDLPSAKQPITEEEKERIDFLRTEIQRRNKTCDRFFCALRKRESVAGKFRYEAFGRKQGAIIDFSDLAAGDRSAFLLFSGDVSEAKYMIALDSDTEPTPESVESLIGFMEHPNHRPTLKRDSHGFFFVEKGYGAAAPRIAANPETSYRTPYSTLLAGNSGTELYHNPHFDLYQDLFSEGIFCGKGILNLELYRAVIGKQFRRKPILSHDLPEGQFLRCATLSDTVFFDEIPNTVLSDEKRNHRWIRGDFQNIQFFSRKKNRSMLFSFKILHNLCRGLFPFACLLLIASTPVLGREGMLLGLFFLFFPLLLGIPSFVYLWLNRHREISHQRWIKNAFGDFFMSLLLLPSRGIGGLDGALRGIFRLWSGRKILEWTTAAGTANRGGNIGDYYTDLYFQLIGFPFLFFPITAPFGFLWLIAPIIAHAVSREKIPQMPTSEGLREDLSDMWSYYADLMNEENHYLPPDNYQQEPLNAVAHRTSPTNIGLGFLSALGAWDLGLIHEEELFSLLEHSLTTQEALPKWKGHLFNWYDTQTCKALSPKFVSTVDSGNWAACLHTARKGMEEFESPRAKKLAMRMEALLEQADFLALYDGEKGVFRIGYDLQDNRLTDSCYDLFASESRLTSFYAIMTHRVPVSHWRHIARPTRKSKGKLLIPGWSGTMFEYFMPHIFLPVYKKTLSSEMLKGVLQEQKDYTGKKYPWGISESGYFAFDNALNYQYRAFGIPSTALRRDLPFPIVISPYSTFLAYPFFPKDGEKNRSCLPKGKYGYYEAIDYRQGDANPRIVQSFMAHHVGMSFLSGVNALKGFCMQKRFIKGEGEAYLTLLTEEIPSRTSPKIADPIRRGEHKQSPSQQVGCPDPSHPNVTLLTNGTLSEIITDSGIGFLTLGSLALTPTSTTPHSPEGIFLFLRNKGELYGTTYAPLYPEKNLHRTVFDNGGATCYGNFRDFETRLSVTIPPDLPVSVRELMIKNGRMTEETFEFVLYLRPSLCRKQDYEAHPEYKDLFTTAHYDDTLRTVSFCRKEKESETWISISSTKEFTFNVRRDSFGTFDRIFSVSSEEIRKHPIFPALILQGEISVRGRSTGTVRFFIGAGETKEEADRAIHSVSARDFEHLRRQHSQAFEAFCHVSDLDARDRSIFGRLTSKLLIPTAKTAATIKLVNRLSQQNLWKYGISGEYPILSLRIGKDSVEQILPFLKSMMLFLRGGAEIDLVILYREAGEYHTPIRTALQELILEVNADLSRHVFPLNIHSVEEYLFFQKISTYFINLERGWKPTTPHRSFHPLRSLPPVTESEKLILETGEGGYTKDGSYLIQKKENLPYRCNHLILANPSFGTVLQDRSLGYTFARNASENRITPRVSANEAYSGGEKLYGIVRGKHYDLLSHASVRFYPHCARYKILCEGTEITAEIFVPRLLSAKIIRISANPADLPPEIVYEPNIILGNRDTGTVTRKTEDGRIYYQNAFNNSFGKGTAVLFGLNCRPEGNSLHFQPTKETPEAFFILAYASGPHSAESLAIALSSSARIEKEYRKTKNEKSRFIRLDSPDRELNCFVNGFLQQQILQSRLFGRTGPSQPGGAFGFRDQLQDALSLSVFDAKHLKHQILRCARCQFEEGDVLHWWHIRPHGSIDGLRTRFSDDPFWLVFACAAYWKAENDQHFFMRKIPYLSAPPLEPGENDRYFAPQTGSLRETLYQHAMRAFRFGYKVGNHGLILFGSGDWNDGMNGIEDGGETVWGSMFAILCAEDFLHLAEKFGSKEDVEFLLHASKSLKEAVVRHAWNGTCYLRGFRGDNSPFGSLDLLPQAFAVFCDLPHADSALEAAMSRLWDPKNKILRLLDPPYTKQTDGFPGSIADYPPGVRENGGQYTHGALWFIKALFHQGKTEEASTVLQGLNPVSRCRSVTEKERYGAEAYVLSADVYSLSDRNGMGGWSYYTGSAGWYLNLITEELLGIRRFGDEVFFSPSIPRAWSGCRGEVSIKQDRFRISVERGSEKGLYENGRKCESVFLSNSVHEIRIIV